MEKQGKQLKGLSPVDSALEAANSSNDNGCLVALNKIKKPEERLKVAEMLALKANLPLTLYVLRTIEGEKYEEKVVGIQILAFRNYERSLREGKVKPEGPVSQQEAADRIGRLLDTWENNPQSAQAMSLWTKLQGRLNGIFPVLPFSSVLSRSRRRSA